MSYDLFLTPGPGKKLDKETFAAHFRSRRWYEVANGQAVYQNEDTGVYFIFDEPEGGMVEFNLNYYRPHVFGLEAAIEVEAFARAFNATAADESGEGWAFDKRRFLHAWNEGNHFGYQSMVKEADEPIHTWPSAKIRDVWLWNYTRPAEDQQDEQSIFVPTIFAVEQDGKVLSVAIWPPECAILMPAVDAVLVPLAQSGKKSQELALAPWSEVLPVVKPYHEQAKGLARYRLEFEHWPPAIEAFLSKPRSAIGKLNGIPLDQVLDQELVEQFR